MDNHGFSVHYPPGARTLPTQVRTLHTKTRTLHTGHIRKPLFFKGFSAVFESKSFKTYKNFFLKPFRHVENSKRCRQKRATSGRMRPGFQGAHSALPCSTSRTSPWRLWGGRTTVQSNGKSRKCLAYGQRTLHQASAPPSSPDATAAPASSTKSG